MAHTFRCDTSIPDVDPDVVFDLSLDVDVHLESMAESGERVVGGTRHGTMALGDDVTWSARHFGIPWRMTSRITACNRPRGFVDEQVRGPFRSFHHDHRFTAVPDGTVMTDVVTLVAPFGPLGRLVERLVLGDYLQSLIEHRGHVIADLATDRRSS